MFHIPAWIRGTNTSYLIRPDEPRKLGNYNMTEENIKMTKYENRQIVSRRGNP